MPPLRGQEPSGAYLCIGPLLLLPLEGGTQPLQIPITSP
ncbi:hypothetical protein GEOBRER4_n2553 [Citrifermentans bremense]|uniref:Uncharacterized protein n=1 Tax=Citrifermentans bremense TaxID=60035 RepID=A0A7R7IZA7_9BACT|nr:hypothetical protein GEOBRER4_n2553 [Citrifermentans bremense]